MKYFTPELHARTCSLDDRIADAAYAEWDKALERYERRLERIRPSFTSGLKRLAADIRLHDAQLFFLGRNQQQCVIVLGTERAPASVVWLEYALEGEPAIEYGLLPPAVRSENCLFLYDEIDVVSRRGHKVFAHRILFSDGLQLLLRFRDVRVHVADQLIPIPDIAPKPAVSQPA